jgi:hypothetical protein
MGLGAEEHPAIKSPATAAAINSDFFIVILLETSISFSNYFATTATKTSDT